MRDDLTDEQKAALRLIRQDGTEKPSMPIEIGLSIACCAVSIASAVAIANGRTSVTPWLFTAMAWGGWCALNSTMFSAASWLLYGNPTRTGESLTPKTILVLSVIVAVGTWSTYPPSDARSGRGFEAGDDYACGHRGCE